MRTRISFSPALLALAACCLVRDGRTQQPAGDAQQPATNSQSSDNHEPVLKTKSFEVVLPVTVRDKKGVLVTNLQKSDFTLTEEGRPQTIKSLTQDANGPLRIGLLVETNHAMSGALDAERKAAEKLVDTLLQGEAGVAERAPAAGAAEGKSAPANRQVFVIHFDREVELLQDFTDSREKLHQELDDMGGTRQSQNDTKGPETTGEDRSERTHGVRGGNQLYDAIFLASDEVMAPKSGRKALIVFSDGVDRGSKDRLNEALDAAEKAHVEIFTIYFKGNRSGRTSIIRTAAGGGAAAIRAAEALIRVVAEAIRGAEAVIRAATPGVAADVAAEGPATPA